MKTSTTTQRGIPAIPEEMFFRVNEDIGRVIGIAEDYPEALRSIDDHYLLAIDAWTESKIPFITGECRRRAERAGKFAAYTTPA